MNETKGKAKASEYTSISRLLVVAEARHWTNATTGYELRQYFGDLIEQAQASQKGTCDICRKPINDPEDVAPRQGHIVHLTCREWPRTWLRLRSNPTLRRIRQSVKAYNSQV